MRRTAPLNNVTHADLCVTPLSGAAFGDAVNQTLIFPTEIEAAQRDYPILIARDAEGEWQLLVLLGLDRDENLFLDGARWTARYIPAVHRRGPFLIGMPAGEGDAGPMIHVDLDDPRVGAEGDRLFLPHGGNSPYLDGVADALRTIHEGHAATRPMFDAFEAAGLIAPVALEIELEEGRHYVVGDRFTIDAERLATLDPDALVALHRAGALHLAYAIRSSLGNVELLIARKRALLAA